jgi:hypothetical protein
VTRLATLPDALTVHRLDADGVEEAVDGLYVDLDDVRAITFRANVVTVETDDGVRFLFTMRTHGDAAEGAETLARASARLS